MHQHTFIRSSFRGAAFAALLALGSVAQAQTAAEPASPEARAEAAFKRADLNSDGKLSKAESEKMPALANKFEELDKDKDGFISMAEFMAGTVPVK